MFTNTMPSVHAMYFCTGCILVVLLYCYCRYIPAITKLFLQYHYIGTAPKCTVWNILYYSSTLSIMLYYGSWKVLGIVPNGIWKPGMVNGTTIIFPTHAVYSTIPEHTSNFIVVLHRNCCWYCCLVLEMGKQNSICQIFFTVQNHRKL